ncbi:hypothetical protein EDC04DRAFT_2717874 [Pisolithus marmoratus]|nr:hypothetical protein EDC04DRAFT_2717874 [Pisolithus marmoratus]
MILCRILCVAWALLFDSAMFCVEWATMHHVSRIYLFSVRRVQTLALHVRIRNHSTPVKLQVLLATSTYPLHKSDVIHYVCTIVHIAAG